MNTKTMRLPPRRGVLTPTKRKERDDYKSPTPTTKSPKPTPFQPESYKAPDPDSSSNQLLAGYLAYEYLTKGTLLGQPFDGAGEQAGPGPGEVSGAEPMKVKPEKKDEAEPREKNYKRYVEVASLIKKGGAHIPGIVNPTQLARFLHM